MSGKKNEWGFGIEMEPIRGALEVIRKRIVVVSTKVTLSSQKFNQ
jgi:hypothetical protein